MEGSWSRHSGCGFWKFRKQSGSWGAADGGNLGHGGQPMEAVWVNGGSRWRQSGLQGAIGEGMIAVFYRKCSFYSIWQGRVTYNASGLSQREMPGDIASTVTRPCRDDSW